MQTERLERNLRAALRETFDGADGPHARWLGSPAARRVAQLERAPRWPLRALAVAAVIWSVAGAGLLAGSMNQRTPAPTAAASPTISQDPRGIFAEVGGWIAFGFADGGAISALDPTGPGDRKGWVKLSDGGGNPRAWSPDGSKLLFVRQLGAGATQELALFVLGTDGTETRIAELGLRSGAAFTPDGARVIFGDGSSIYIVDPKGGVPEPLLADDPPSWAFSPDGSQIAYLDWGRGDSEHSLRVMNSDGTGKRVVTEDPTVLVAGHIRGPSVDWSPDGQRLVFGIESQVWVVNVDGSGLKELTAGTFELESRGTAPHWSPDGSLISYTLGAQLIIVRPDGTPVGTFAGAQSGPWSPAARS